MELLVPIDYPLQLARLEFDVQFVAIHCHDDAEAAARATPSPTAYFLCVLQALAGSADCGLDLGINCCAFLNRAEQGHLTSQGRRIQREIRTGIALWERARR